MMLRGLIVGALVLAGCAGNVEPPVVNPPPQAAPTPARPMPSEKYSVVYRIRCKLDAPAIGIVECASDHSVTPGFNGVVSDTSDGKYRSCAKYVESNAYEDVCEVGTACNAVAENGEYYAGSCI